MKHLNFLRGAAVALVVVMTLGTAQAATISGSLNFGGAATSNPGPDLENANGLTFSDGILVTDASGDFAGAGIVFGDTGGILNFLFNAAPIEGLLTIGDFSFTLETLEIIDQRAGFLVLAGTGTLSSPGFDNTAFNFSFSADGVGSQYSFSGTIAAVPVPGALLLMMSGLAALGIRRRV